MVFVGSAFKPACNGVNTAWFPGCIKILGILCGIWVYFLHFKYFFTVCTFIFFGMFLGTPPS